VCEISVLTLIYCDDANTIRSVTLVQIYFVHSS